MVLAIRTLTCSYVTLCCLQLFSHKVYQIILYQVGGFKAQSQPASSATCLYNMFLHLKRLAVCCGTISKVRLCTVYHPTFFIMKCAT